MIPAHSVEVRLPPGVPFFASADTNLSRSAPDGSPNGWDSSRARHPMSSNCFSPMALTRAERGLAANWHVRFGGWLPLGSWQNYPACPIWLISPTGRSPVGANVWVTFAHSQRPCRFATTGQRAFWRVRKNKKDGGTMGSAVFRLKKSDQFKFATSWTVC